MNSSKDQPNITYSMNTARLSLRPFSLEDVPQIFQMSLEQGIQDYMPDQVYSDEIQTKEVVKLLNAQITRHVHPKNGPIVLGIYLKKSTSVIGHVSLGPAFNEVEVGYAIENSKQGNGFATEAIKCFTEWAFQSYSISTLLGVVDFKNQNSCKVLEKCNFVFNRNSPSKKAIYKLLNPFIPQQR